MINLIGTYAAAAAAAVSADNKNSRSQKRCNQINTQDRKRQDRVIEMNRKRRKNGGCGANSCALTFNHWTHAATDTARATFSVPVCTTK